jgi:hypothetical protein
MLAGMGALISDADFTAIIMGSLPESYQPILSSMSTAVCIAKVPLTPYDLISFVSEEYKHRQLAINRTMKKVGNSAFTADNPNTTQTLKYTKDKYNAKIIKRKVSPKVPPTTYKGQRIK